MFPTLFAAEVTQYVGRIQGGWEYIWAAYIITWTTLSVFACHLAGLRMPQRAQLFSSISWLLITVGVGGVLTFAWAPKGYLALPVLPLIVSIWKFQRYLSAPLRMS